MFAETLLVDPDTPQAPAQESVALSQFVRWTQGQPAPLTWLLAVTALMKQVRVLSEFAMDTGFDADSCRCYRRMLLRIWRMPPYPRG